MAHQEGHEEDHLAEGWYSGFEEECLEILESSETNMEDNVQKEADLAMQKLYFHFQNSATAIAQLYKDRTHGLSLWIPFQNAASSVTSMYKDSVDTAKHYMEVGVQRGRQHHIKDIISWVKKRRRHIRREDLLAFLSGKNLPQRTKMPNNMIRHSQSRIERSFPRFQSADSLTRSNEPDLQCFKEAIALQDLDGAMSNISMGYRPHGNSNPTQIPKNNLEELNSFIIDEFSRNCDTRKRAATPELSMDSPTRKKNRGKQSDYQGKQRRTWTNDVTDWCGMNNTECVSGRSRKEWRSVAADLLRRKWHSVTVCTNCF